MQDGVSPIWVRDFDSRTPTAIVIELVFEHLRRWRCLGRLAFRGVEHILHHFEEVFQAGCWNDDGVATTSDILSYAEEATSGVFLQGENEGFSLHLEFFCAQGLLGTRGFGCRRWLLASA